MKIEFDPVKNAANIAERGLSFAVVADFEWDTAHVVEDIRKTYPERRFIAAGFVDNRLHILCFTPLHGGVRVISFRKANRRERRNYEQQAID
jgi:uncharacterized protein